MNEIDVDLSGEEGKRWIAALVGKLRKQVLGGRYLDAVDLGLGLQRCPELRSDLVAAVERMTEAIDEVSAGPARLHFKPLDDTAVISLLESTQCARQFVASRNGFSTVQLTALLLAGLRKFKGSSMLEVLRTIYSDAFYFAAEFGYAKDERAIRGLIQESSALIQHASSALKGGWSIDRLPIDQRRLTGFLPSVEIVEAITVCSADYDFDRLVEIWGWHGDDPIHQLEVVRTETKDIFARVRACGR